MSVPFHATSLRELTARITPRQILVGGWLLVFVYAFPGYMSKDSVDQLLEARTGLRTDSYAPLMTFLWGLLDRFISGPVLMLVLQTSLLLGGTFKLMARVLPPRGAALVACAVVLFPPVLTTMAVIWKDAQLAGFLLAGTAGALSSQRRWRVLGWISMGAAAAMSDNATVAILPLAAFIVWTTSARSRRGRIALGLLASLAVLVGAMAVNKALTVRRAYPWYHSVAFLDVAGTTRFSAPRTDEQMRYALRDTGLVVTDDVDARIKRAYDPRTSWWLTHGDERIWNIPATKRERLAMRRAWFELVSDDPGAYLQHRARVFGELLGISQAKPPSAVWWSFAESPEQAASVNHNHSHSPYQRKLAAFFTALGKGPLYRACWYFGIAWLILGIAIWRRHGLVTAIVASGLAYELSYFFIAPSPDFRYSHWMVTCIVAVLFGAGAKLAHERHRRGTPA